MCIFDRILNAFQPFQLSFASGNTLSMGFMEHIPNIFLVFDSVFLSLGLASNLFVCFIMTRRKLVGKNLSNFYIFHLSMAEVIYRFTMAVVRIFTSRIDFRLLSHGECKAMQFFPHATCATVFFLLTGIAMDRKKPHRKPSEKLGSYWSPQEENCLNLVIFCGYFVSNNIRCPRQPIRDENHKTRRFIETHFHHTCVYLRSSKKILCKQK